MSHIFSERLAIGFRPIRAVTLEPVDHEKHEIEGKQSLARIYEIKPRLCLLLNRSAKLIVWFIGIFVLVKIAEKRLPYEAIKQDATNLDM